eukprot:5248021-Alexandrium_andersonii.AAC.1
MSASLVGSEMCIRDRSRNAPDKDIILQARSGLSAERAARRVYRRLEQPVSYTHLTLPTICSV